MPNAFTLQKLLKQYLQEVGKKQTFVSNDSLVQHKTLRLGKIKFFKLILYTSNNLQRGIAM